MPNELANDAALLQEFLTESGELLQKMDEDLVLLESSPADTELLNRVFREFHTIKGTSSFLAFEALVAVSHAAEDYLNKLRKGESLLDKRGMDALLAAGDALRDMLGDIANKRDIQQNHQSLLSELETLRACGIAPPRLGEVLVEQQLLTSPQVDEALTASRETGTKIGEALVEKGAVTREQVKEALVHQSTAAVSNVQSSNMRVDVRKLDELVNLVGELVLERNRLTQISREVCLGRLAGEELTSALSQSTTRLSFVTDELQSSSLKTRMVPIETLFRRFPRMVRDVANALGKTVKLELSGENTELDRTMVEQIADPLIHLVRNSLDHGIERTEARVLAGKSRFGVIRLEASQQSDQVVISIFDDGAGIDLNRVTQKAIERGLVSQERLESMSRREQLELIFAPGLTTAQNVTNISGRGVGMDVVRSNISRINGTVQIDSTPGKGTTIYLRVPLTMAILPVLLVETGSEIYGIPLRSVLKTVRIEQSQIHRVEGQEVLHMPGETLPLLRLQTIFNLPGEVGSGPARVVVLTVGEKRLGVPVDRLLGQESTVIKPFSARLAHSRCIAGATISGDGRVRLVLDPAGLLGEIATDGSLSGEAA
jgi:two-component system, chemotaxis family, sensor kinase CheA